MEINSGNVVQKLPAWKKIVERFKRMQEGETVTHEELELLIGHDRKTSQYTGPLQTAKDRFQEETGVRMQSVHRVGYMYPTGRQQLDASDRRLRGAGRSIFASAQLAADIRDDRLPDSVDRQRRDHRIERFNYIAELVRTEHRALTGTVGTPEVKPQLVAAE